MHPDYQKQYYRQFCSDSIERFIKELKEEKMKCEKRIKEIDPEIENATIILAEKRNKEKK